MTTPLRRATLPTWAARCAALSVMLLLIACAPQASREGEELAARSALWEQAMNTGDLDALAALYTEDCRLMPPGTAMVQGREAVREMFQGMHADGLTVDLETIEARVAADIGYHLGTYTVLTAAGEPVDRGKFAEVWRQVGGVWLIADDIWNADAPTDGGELVVITHQVRDRERWLDAWSGEDSRHQLFLDNGASKVTVLESVDTPDLTGLAVQVSDMNAFHAMMVAPGTDEAKIADGVMEKGFHVFSEVK